MRVRLISTYDPGTYLINEEREAEFLLGPQLMSFKQDFNARPHVELIVLLCFARFFVYIRVSFCFSCTML